MHSGDRHNAPCLEPLTTEEAANTSAGAIAPPDTGSTGPGNSRPQAPRDYPGIEVSPIPSEAGARPLAT